MDSPPRKLKSRETLPLPLALSCCGPLPAGRGRQDPPPSAAAGTGAPRQDTFASALNCKVQPGPALALTCLGAAPAPRDPCLSHRDQPLDSPSSPGCGSLGMAGRSHPPPQLSTAPQEGSDPLCVLDFVSDRDLLALPAALSPCCHARGHGPGRAFLSRLMERKWREEFLIDSGSIDKVFPKHFY